MFDTKPRVQTFPGFTFANLYPQKTFLSTFTTSHAPSTLGAPDGSPSRRPKVTCGIFRGGYNLQLLGHSALASTRMRGSETLEVGDVYCLTCGKSWKN